MIALGMSETEGPALNFQELVGELHELVGRVVGLEIRDGDKNLIARAEGEFGDLEGSDGEWSFQLGGRESREGGGMRFEQASWLGIELAAERVLETRDVSTGMGPRVDLRISVAGGMSITLWPAMPPEEQWTDRHFENR
jgi:hypothetical protein